MWIGSFFLLFSVFHILPMKIVCNENNRQQPFIFNLKHQMKIFTIVFHFLSVVSFPLNLYLSPCHLHALCVFAPKTELRKLNMLRELHRPDITHATLHVREFQQNIWESSELVCAISFTYFCN